MQPGKNDLLDLAEKNKSKLNRAISSTDYDHSGMWYSELVIFVLLCDYFECDTIVESGRARGVSTDFLSKYFDGGDVNIVSIDNRPNSDDAAIAESKLSNRSNVSLKYGDSKRIVPELVTDSTAVLIDGPKADAAIQMGAELLINTPVPFIALHDLNKDYFYRELTEIVFDSSIYTDKESLVDKFKRYDGSIHDINKSVQDEGSMYGPYLKSGSESHSYGPTLGIFFNSEEPVNGRVYENYKRYSDVGFEDLFADFLRERHSNGGVVTRRVTTTILKIGRSIYK